MTADRPLFGVALMLGFCLLAPMGDAIAKHLGDLVPLGLLLLSRFAIQPLILAPLARAQGATFRQSRRVLWLTFLRTGLHIAGIGMMFTALRFLPLADAIAIAFVMPFIMLLLGRFVLGEEVGPARLAACIVGFVGTLLVIQPNFSEVGAPALLPLGVAVVFALFMLVTRQVAKEVDPIVLQATSGAMATVILLPAMLVLGPVLPEFALAALPPGTGPWLLALGALGTFAHLLMTWSLRYAPSATLAPMQYLEIPVATVVGWVAFGDLPNGLAALGIVITVAAGLFVIARERAIARAAAAPPAV